MSESGLGMYMVAAKGKGSLFCSHLLFFSPVLPSSRSLWGLCSTAWLLKGDLANNAVH